MFVDILRGQNTYIDYAEMVLDVNMTKQDQLESSTGSPWSMLN